MMRTTKKQIERVKWYVWLAQQDAVTMECPTVASLLSRAHDALVVDLPVAAVDEIRVIVQDAAIEADREGCEVCIANIAYVGRLLEEIWIDLIGSIDRQEGYGCMDWVYPQRKQRKGEL